MTMLVIIKKLILGLNQALFLVIMAVCDNGGGGATVILVFCR
jgi:hypothetical protein